MKVPIIILNWHGLEDTQECMRSLKAQTFQDFEVYLVDNGSGIDEQASLQNLYKNDIQINLIFNDKNLGFTLGNNQILEDLLKKTGAPYVILLNNDTAVEPDWLRQLLKAAQEHGVDMVSSKMINYYNRDRMDNAGHRLLNTLEVLPIGNEEPVNNYKTPFENWGACGGAALYSTQMLRDLGIFDEIFRNGYEDVELGIRAVLCGYKSVYAPKAVVYHKVSRSINKIRDMDYTLGIQRHVYYIMLKLFPLPVLICCFPLILLRFALAIVINIVTLRGKFLWVQIMAVGYLFFVDGLKFFKARRNFQKKNTIISSSAIFHRMNFFLRQDWKRFLKYIIRREKMVFEKY